MKPIQIKIVNTLQEALVMAGRHLRNAEATSLPQKMKPANTGTSPGSVPFNTGTTVLKSSRAMRKSEPEK